MGRVVARSLRDRVGEGVEVREHDGEAAALLDWLTQADAVWLVDASASGAEPGAIRRLDACDGPLPEAPPPVSSHGFGPAEAIELARAMRSLPATCILFAVEGRSFEAGRPLSPVVAAAAQEVADRIVVELTRDRDAGATARGAR